MGSVFTRDFYSIWGVSIGMSQGKQMREPLTVIFFEYCFDQSSEWVGSYSK